MRRSVSGGAANYAYVLIPSTYNGLPVTEIAWGAFVYWTELTAVVIPNSVTKINDGAFAYTGLTSIVIPNSVINIGSQAFEGCELLTSISIENGSQLSSIGWGAFSQNSNLTNIFIPQSVITINSYAFSGCSSLSIYTEWTSRPSGWAIDWNPSNCPVYWGI